MTARNEEILEQLIKAQRAIIFVLSSLAETRDPETGGHIKRIQEYSVLIAQVLRLTKDKEEINDLFIRNIYDCSVLHDIGKVGIPDAILQKQGPLTDEEYSTMKLHTVIGYNTLREAVSEIKDSPFVSMALDIILHHHENWDGSGYPAGLSKEEIPLCSRIVAFADYYDALVSKRPYKEAFTSQEAKEIILLNKHKFDPTIIDVFLENEEEFERIREDFSDIPPPVPNIRIEK